jgi:hypothetical protein
VDLNCKADGAPKILRGRKTVVGLARDGRELCRDSQYNLLPQFKCRAALLSLDQVTLRIGKNHIAHRLMIFDVAGATAEMAVERLGNGILKIGARHAGLC